MITVADEKDIPAIMRLVNLAYRGEESKRGWTTEAYLLLGDKRTDEENLRELMHTPGSVFVIFRDTDNTISGSVYLSKKVDRLYLGMLSVSPELQAKGIGKLLMAAAGNHAREQSCRSIFMRVITLRKELIN